MEKKCNRPPWSSLWCRLAEALLAGAPLHPQVPLRCTRGYSWCRLAEATRRLTSITSRYAARQPSDLFHLTQGFAALTLGFYVSPSGLLPLCGCVCVALRAFAALRPPGSASLHQGLLMVSPRRGYPSPYVHYITLRSSTTIRFISPHPGLRCAHPGLLCVALRAFAALRLCMCRPPGFCRFAAVYVSPSGLLPLCGLACWFLPCWAFYFSSFLGGAYRSHSKFPKRASICLLTAPSLPLMQEVTNALELG